MLNMKKKDFVRMLEGRSLALPAKYKPRIMLDLADRLIREFSGECLEVSDVWEDLCASYEKLGYMLYAKKKTKELSPKISHWALIVEYYVSNFIFNCKAFLDCISNFICHALNLDVKKPVNRDIARPEFYKKLAMKNLALADRIKPFLGWTKYIAEYRVELIHKYQFFSLSRAPTSAELEIIREPTRPVILYDKKRSEAFLKELEKKHGNSTILVHDFLEETLNNAKSLFETVISGLLEEIQNEGSDAFSWEKIDTSHMQIDPPEP